MPQPKNFLVLKQGKKKLQQTEKEEEDEIEEEEKSAPTSSSSFSRLTPNQRKSETWLETVKDRVKSTKPAILFQSYLADLEIIRNSYQHDDVVGGDVFAPRLYNKLKRMVFKSASVQAALETFRVRNPTMSISSVNSKFDEVYGAMATKFDDKNMRGVAYIVQYILQQMYSGIHISQKELDRVREAAQKAQEKGIPLILLPSHKSHVDYMVLSYVFLLSGISVPFIAAGDNLMMPIAGNLLRSAGAFFIKRKMDDNHMYRAVFNEYISAILELGYNLEFFLEGGRSRTGKLLKPKTGMLTIVLNSFLSGKMEDAYILPISIGYDKVIETESYVKELLGGSKEKESLRELLRSTRLLALNFGRVDVRIAKPFSLKEFVEEQVSTRRLNTENPADVRSIVHVLAYQVLNKINLQSSVMPTSIVVTAILTHRGRGISRKELIERFAWVRQLILVRGGRAARPDTKAGGSPEEADGQVVDVALNVLGNMIGRQKNVIEPVFTPLKRFELSYYRNQIVHIFVNEGVVACSLYANTRGTLKGSAVEKTVLLKDVAFLSQLFKIEFIYTSSGNNIAETFEATIAKMESQVPPAVVSPTSEVVAVNPVDDGQFQFLCALFWPFIDSYWLMCTSFYSLWPSHMMEEKTFMQKVQSLGFTLYYEGDLGYYEGISKDTLGNAAGLFLSLGIIQKQIIDAKGTTVVKLAPEYTNEEKLIALIDHIGKFRRESKYTSADQTALNPKLKKIVRLNTPSLARL